MAVTVNSRAREDVSSNEGLNGGLLVIFEGFNYGSSFASLFGTNHPNLFDFQVSSFVELRTSLHLLITISSLTFIKKIYSNNI